MSEKKKKKQALPVLSRYFAATLRYPWTLSFALLFVITAEGAALAGPIFFKQFIDTISGDAPSAAVVQALFIILGSYFGVMVLTWFLRRMRTIYMYKLQTDVPADLMNESFTYMSGHSHEFYTNNFVGSLTKKINRYGRAYVQILDTVMFNFLQTALFAAGVIVILSMRNLWLGIAILAWTLVFMAVQIFMARWRQHYKTERAAADTKMSGTLSDAVGNYLSMKLFAAEKREQSQVAKHIEEWRLATRRVWNSDLAMNAVQGLLSIVIEVGLLAAAVILWQQGAITVGDFVLIQVYILGLIERVWAIGNVMRNMYDALADAGEMIDVFETPYQVADRPEAIPLRVKTGSIAFTDVAFSFTKERTILGDFNLSIPGGEKVALVGPSGAGKSTITKLLLRLHDVTDGSVSIDDQDLRSVTQTSLREAISYVPQEPVLFHRSLKENIKYGKPDATDEEVIEAAKKAHCHEFISEFADGYETLVGERGVKLSGGERQRVAIARAILKNAPILVLDEATSSLDSESEALIQDALRTLMEGKTVIVIAHRLSTIMRMDRIVVIEKGKVAATGTHADLVADKDGLYQKLWNIQAGGFIE